MILRDFLKEHSPNLQRINQVIGMREATFNRPNAYESPRNNVKIEDTNFENT
jgi:hypothetical protein